MLVWDLCRTYPDQIAVSLDVRPNRELAIRGWMVDSDVQMDQALLDMSSAGAAAFIVSEAGRDALTEQSNLGILREALETATEPVIAAGGARDMADLRSLAELEAQGRRLGGIIVGREITEGRFTMEEARKAVD